METSARPIVFLHIPKTAGMTFHEILADQYRDRKHMLFYQISYAKLYEGLVLKKKLSLGVIRGHLLYGFHHLMPVEPVYLTLLRNPITRTISGYEFIKKKTDHPFHKEIIDKNYSLYEFLSKKMVPNFDNMHVRFLCGDNSMPFGAVNESHLSQAKKNLMEKHVLFGITEKFDESIMYFKRELGWTMPYYIKMNVATHVSSENELDDATRKEVLKCNDYDIQLYEFARDLFENRIDALGSDFQVEVEAFKKENEKGMFKPKKRNLFGEFLNRFIPG